MRLTFRTPNPGTRNKASRGALPAADLVIEPQGPAMLDLLRGTLTARDAIASGKIRVQGDPAHLDLFTRLFHVPAAPERPTGLVAR